VLGISVALALNLILYFVAIPLHGVAVAIFSATWLPGVPRFRRAADPQGADRADRLCRARPSAWPGMALDPRARTRTSGRQALGYRPLLRLGRRVSCYAVYLLFAKSLRGLDVRSTAVVFTAERVHRRRHARARPARRELRHLPLTTGVDLTHGGACSVW